MKQISISEQNYQRLQALARPLEDTADSLLERLLDSVEEQDIQAKDSFSDNAPAGPLDLMTTHGRLPHGLLLRAKYKGMLFEARLDSGAVVFNERRFPSLSSAAIAALHSAGSNRPTENGWRFWQYFDPDQNDWSTAENLKQPAITDCLREVLRKNNESSAT